jgi:hypothetical protein
VAALSEKNGRIGFQRSTSTSIPASRKACDLKIAALLEKAFTMQRETQCGLIGECTRDLISGENWPGDRGWHSPHSF